MDRLSSAGAGFFSPWQDQSPTRIQAGKRITLLIASCLSVWRAMLPGSRPTPLRGHSRRFHFRRDGVIRDRDRRSSDQVPPWPVQLSFGLPRIGVFSRQGGCAVRPIGDRNSHPGPIGNAQRTTIKRAIRRRSKNHGKKFSLSTTRNITKTKFQARKVYLGKFP